MSKSSYRILGDENVEQATARYLEKQGHDVEMVVDVLEPGVDDDEVAAYARENDQLVLTSDDDFLSMGYPTLFQEDDRMSAFELAEIVDAIAEQLAQDQVETYGRIKLVDDWR